MPPALRRFTLAAFLAIAFAGPLAAQDATRNSTPEGMIYLNSDRPLKEPANHQDPLSYRDPASGVIYYVESDGRHVAAITPSGKILWARYPFLDAKLLPYRMDNPPIVEIGAPIDWMIKGPKGHRQGRFIRINFSTTQFGLMNVQNGDFLWMGQD